MKTKKIKYLKKNKTIQKGGLYFFKKRTRTWKISNQYGKPPMDVESYRNAEVRVLNRIAKNCNGNYRACIQDIQGRLSELKDKMDRISMIDYHDYETYQAEYREHIKPVLDNLDEVIKLRTKVNTLYEDPDAHAVVVEELIALEKEIKKATEKLTENYTLANKEEKRVKEIKHQDQLYAKAMKDKREAEEAAEKLATEKLALEQATIQGQWMDNPELPEQIKISNEKFREFRKKVKYALKMLEDIQHLKSRAEKLTKDESNKIAQEETHIVFLNTVFEEYSTFEDSYNEFTEDAERSKKFEMIKMNSEHYLQIMQQDLARMSRLGINPP
jgi:DNA repair exonuclease SbcCD ATPase subunit